MSRFLSLVLLSLYALTSHAQVVRRPVVRSSGNGTVSFQPDQVTVSVGVTTQAATAQEAGDTNATQTNAVLAALRSLIGNNGTIRTLGYSLSPIYRNNTGGVSTIVGYTANNTVAATIANISMAGRLIDAAIQAGATNVQGLQFSLKDSNPARAQALREATLEAKRNAEAIAGGLGLRLGNVSVAEQGSTVTPVNSRVAGTAASTPIEPGNVDVSATVSLEIELIQ
jgi:uncharacterized protein YggE